MTPDLPAEVLLDVSIAVGEPIWWARRASSRLAGTRLPAADFDFAAAATEGLTYLVSLTGSVSVDCSPLTGVAFDIEDLYGRATPSNPSTEWDLVAEAASTVRTLLDDGEGVLVHCLGGTGRTGTVIGAVLVSLGHELDDVADWLDRVHQRRGQAGWPECPWQRDALKVLS